MTKAFSTPISFEEADKRAVGYLAGMSLEEKIALLGGYSRFFIRGFPNHGIPPIFMSDATQGIRVDARVTDRQGLAPLEKSTAFPSPILLAATWNPELAEEYARCVGEEARAAGAAFLLGPGMNIYRISQCGRNFEYLGEDPFLASRMVERYVTGMQTTGTAATLKHFACNNTDYHRRCSNSIVDERTLHEIYLPAFKAGIEAGAVAVMTAYNQLNGEWCGQSRRLITEVLRGELGFRWLVMSDWTSLWDGEKVVRSGQDLEMPEAVALSEAKSLLERGKVTQAEIERMVRSVIRACVAMGFYDRPAQDLSCLDRFTEHAEVALEVAREGIVLLKNGKLLPIDPHAAKHIAVTGKFARSTAYGSGSAYVAGYGAATLIDALAHIFGRKVDYVDPGDRDSISRADLLVVSVGTEDTEGADRPFDLPAAELAELDRMLGWNKRSVVVVSSGGGINMSRWIDRAGAVLYAWYGGQTGSRAVAEVISGAVNPSGKLPITIERRFEDSPGYGYIPKGEEVHLGRHWVEGTDKEYDVIYHDRRYDVEYREGIFVGYRWYDQKGIAPLFPFGFGLSYSRFVYSDLKVSKEELTESEEIQVSFRVKNIGDVAGSEIAQLYVHDRESSHPRPPKELKGFRKVPLDAGEEKEVVLKLGRNDFSYWNPDKRSWYAEPGEFEILVGASSAELPLKGSIWLR